MFFNYWLFSFSINYIFLTVFVNLTHITDKRQLTNPCWILHSLVTGWFLCPFGDFFFSFLPLPVTTPLLDFYRRCSYVLLDVDTPFRVPSVYWRTFTRILMGQCPSRCLGIFSFMSRTPSLRVGVIQGPPSWEAFGEALFPSLALHSGC